MPAGLVNQIERMVSSQLNLANDVLPGQSVASGTGQAQYGGVRGNRIALGPDEIRFNAATGTLFGGIYQYVQTNAGSAASPARGAIAFRDLSVAENTFTVNADPKPSAAVPTLVAGIFLNAITKGNFGWIQLGGRASVLFGAAFTGVAAAGVNVFASASTAGSADLGVAAAYTVASLQNAIAGNLGIAETTPVASTISVVQLSMAPWSRV